MPQFNIRQTHSILPAVQHLLDGMMIAFTLPLSQWLLQQPMNDRTWAVSLTAAAIFFVVGELCGLYQGRKEELRISRSRRSHWLGLPVTVHCRHLDL